MVWYSQEKKVPAGVGVRVGVGQEWEEARNGKILQRSFRRKERGSRSPHTCHGVGDTSAGETGYHHLATGPLVM